MESAFCVNRPMPGGKIRGISSVGMSKSGQMKYRVNTDTGSFQTSRII
jgi:hypothetical protein